MSSYSIHVFGIDLSENYEAIDRHAERLMRAEGDEDAENFDLGEYVQEKGLGGSEYDGGGDGQLTYVGVQVFASKRGIVVTDEIEAKVQARIANMPTALSEAIKAAFGGTVPEAAFHVMTGYG